MPPFVGPYIAIARPDHWFKNAFMVLGVLLAAFYQPDLLRPGMLGVVAWAVVTTCLLASSNYVLNEILDAHSDLSHPTKRHRPVASGQARLGPAYVEWLLLAAIGLGMASLLNRPFLLSTLFLLVMGVVYNVPPVRTKDLPYVDVLSEAINNPIRLMLGWFTVDPNEFPPVSLLIAYWMLGAFLMAVKRLAEYRFIGNPASAVSYRHSFRYQTQESILVSAFFYAVIFALFFGIFIVRYHLELILLVPFVAGLICYYVRLGFKINSVAQRPEHLYRERAFMTYLTLCAVAFFALMFVQIPVLYDVFNVPASSSNSLWQLDAP